MPDRLGVWMHRRQFHSSVGKQAEIFPSMLPPRLIPPIEMPELHPQHRRLQAVEPAVDAFYLVDVLVDAAVIGQHPHASNEVRVSTDDGPAISVAAEVLPREETEAGGVS